MLGLTPTAEAIVGDALDGDWQGTLTTLDGPELLPPEPWPNFRISIAADVVRVFLENEDGAFDAIKPDGFRIARLGNSALISAIDASPRVPLGNGWVESWSFSVTLKDEDTLSTVFVRQVNNHHASHDEYRAFFSTVLSGELRRVSLDHV